MANHKIYEKIQSNEKGCENMFHPFLKVLEMKTKIFSTKAFEKPFSREYFKAVKENELFKVKDLLCKNRYLIFDFDDVISLLFIVEVLIIAQVAFRSLKIHQTVSM